MENIFLDDTEIAILQPMETTITNLINLLDSCFATSFRHTASVKYSVIFKTSNVLQTVEKLKQLEYNVKNNISTEKHVGANITTDDVVLTINTLNALIIHYESINGIHTIPSKLKLHEMLKTLREHELPNAKMIAKEVVTEIIQPAKTAKKLTKKQKIAELASQKSAERKIEIIKKITK